MTLRARLLISGVLCVLGFLLVVQLRSQGGGDGLEQRGTAELTSLIANLNTSNDQLSSEVGALERDLQALEAGGSQGGVSVSELRADLDRLRLWSGLDPAAGRGVEIVVNGPVTSDAVNDVLDELRASGAQALAVGRVRVVPGTVVAGNAGSLSVENQPLADPLLIAAIGDPTNLAANLVRGGGVVGRIQATVSAVSVDVTPVEQLVLPASTRSLIPVHARPPG